MCSCADGGSETIKGTFLVGADGMGSVVRKAIGAEFDGHHNSRIVPDPVDDI